MGEKTVLCVNEFQSGIVPGYWKVRALDPELTGSRKNDFCGNSLDNL